MTFSDPLTLRRRLERAAAKPSFATVEVGHSDSKTGMIIRVEGALTLPRLEMLLADVLEDAAGSRHQSRRMTQPGWWVGVVWTVADAAGMPAIIERGRAERSRSHACLIIPRGGIIDAHVDWPLVRLGASPSLKDLRGELATMAGPTDGDLDRYRVRRGSDESLAGLRHMFDLGVLVWSSGRDRDGRLMVDVAGR